MRQLLRFLLPLALMLPVSCSKEMPGGTRSDALKGDEEHTVTVQISAPQPKTKAYTPENLPLTDGVSRLDLFLFYNTETGSDRHIVLTPDVSGTTTFTLKEKANERVGIIVMANLDDDTAALMDGKTLAQLSATYDLVCPIIWSAGNFDFDKIVMLGAAYVTFNADSTTEIELVRTAYRIDLGSIIFDPDNPDLVGQEVLVKNIVMTNLGNYIVPSKSSSLSYFYSGNASVLGSAYSLSNAFGGVTRGYSYYTNTSRTWSATGTFSPGGTGVLAGTFPFYLNNNYKLAKGVLTIDTTGDMRVATSHTYDTANGEGRIAAAGAGAGPHSFTVNRSFYGFLGFGGTDSNATCDYDRQVLSPKFVLELSIGGKTYFYPIRVNYPQPNTVYQISSITIKDVGSEYSNFFEKKYAATYNISVADWNELEVSNIIVGVDPVTGQPVSGAQQ